MIAARMQKMKADNLIGIGNHNQRKTRNHSNPDIEVDRSHLNYDLVNRTENYKTDIEQFINEKKSSTRAVRKDAVLVNEWIITSDQAFFKGLDPQETKLFFEAAKDYFAENFGEENIRYTEVHLDERTPHMHLGIVPFTEDKRLTAKEVFDRKALQKIQDELPDYLQKSGFDINRGEEGSERKHLTVKEYKDMKEKQKKITKELEEKKEALKEFTYSDHQEVEKKASLLNKKYVRVKSTDLKKLEAEAKQGILYKKQNVTLEAQNSRLESKISRLENDIKELTAKASQTIEKLTTRLKKANTELKLRWNFAKEMLRRKAPDFDLEHNWERLLEMRAEEDSKMNAQQKEKPERGNDSPSR